MKRYKGDENTIRRRTDPMLDPDCADFLMVKEKKKYKEYKMPSKFRCWLSYWWAVMKGDY